MVMNLKVIIITSLFVFLNQYFIYNSSGLNSNESNEYDDDDDYYVVAVVLYCYKIIKIYI